MDTRGTIGRYVAEYADDPDYEAERLLIEINEALVERMAAEGLRPSDLAERLGVSRPYVTKLLNGNENLTLKSLVRIANALRAKVDVRIAPRQSSFARRSNFRTEPMSIEVSRHLKELGVSGQSALAA